MHPAGKMGARTCVGLDARSNLAGADIVEEGNVLAEDSLEVLFTEALGADLPGVDPDVHVEKGADERADTWWEPSVGQRRSGEKRDMPM